MNEEFLKQLYIEGTLRNLRESTLKTYRVYIDSFLKYAMKQPEELTCLDVREFIYRRKLEGLSPASLNIYNASLRFFFRYVLKKLWDPDIVPRMKLDYRLPEVLTREEIAAILSTVTNIKHRSIIATMYASGLRVSEVVRLHYKDISRSRMQIHVRQSKSRSDRYTLLSEKSLHLLTEYWYQCGRPQDILYPSKCSKSYLTTDAIRSLIKRAASEAGIERRVTAHSLRHSFATHLLEDGVERHYIQELLGHRCAHSTEAYLHVSNKVLMGIQSPLDRWE